MLTCTLSRKSSFFCLKLDIVELDTILVDIVKFAAVDLVIFELDFIGWILLSGHC